MMSIPNSTLLHSAIIHAMTSIGMAHSLSEAIQHVTAIVPALNAWVI